MTTIQHPSLCDVDGCMHSADVYCMNEDGTTAHKLCACCTVAMTAPMTAQAIIKFTAAMKADDVDPIAGATLLLELLGGIAAGNGAIVNVIHAADEMAFDDMAATIDGDGFTIDSEGVWNV